MKSYQYYMIIGLLFAINADVEGQYLFSIAFNIISIFYMVIGMVGGILEAIRGES